MAAKPPTRAGATLERLNRPEDVLADLRVRLHDRLLALSQGPRLVENRLRNSDLADVVEDGAELQVAHHVEIELELGRHGGG